MQVPHWLWNLVFTLTIALSLVDPGLDLHLSSVTALVVLEHESVWLDSYSLCLVLYQRQGQSQGWALDARLFQEICSPFRREASK